MSEYRLTESGGLRASEEATDLRALENYAPGLTPLYTDDFDRADGAPGSDWVEAVVGSYLIASNILVRQGGGSDFVQFTSPMPTADHWVEADVTGTNTVYVVIHGRGSGAFPGDNCYMGYLVPGGGIAIGKQSGGSFATVDQIGFTHGDAHTLRLELEGSEQRLYVDDVLQLTTGDTTHTTGGYVGFNCNGSPGVYDNFAAGTLGS